MSGIFNVFAIVCGMVFVYLIVHGTLYHFINDYYYKLYIG